MDILQNFKTSVRYYQPSTDSGTWADFYNKCWSQDFTQLDGEKLKRLAYDCMSIRSGADEGMWEDRANRLTDFLTNNIGVVDEDVVGSETLQYGFIACFLNGYTHAAHNEDLWKSFNDAAAGILAQDAPIPSPRSGDLALAADAGFQPHPGGNHARWLTLKRTKIALYRPSEDTDTWGLYINVLYDMVEINQFTFTFRITFLLRDIGSVPDEGMWASFASRAKAFNEENLGRYPNDAAAEIALSIKFCNIFLFDFAHAAHNKDLFKMYHDEFEAASAKITLLMG